jgi:hypothetical protein
VCDVVDARYLDADEDRARNGGLGFHDLGGSTNRAGAWGHERNEFFFGQAAA